MTNKKKAAVKPSLKEEEQVLLGAFRIIRECDVELVKLKPLTRQLNMLNEKKQDAIDKIESMIYGENRYDDEEF